jgi:WD40 repeat protein
MPGNRFDISLEANLAAVFKPDQMIHLYELKGWGEVGTLKCDQPQLSALKLSRDGRFLAAVYYNGELSVWDVESRKRLYTITVDRHAGEVLGATFSPDGELFATGAQEHDVKIWESRSGNPLQALPGHRDDVSAVAFSPDGKTLATASYDNSLRLWDTVTWKPRVVRENALTARVFALVYDPTGSRLAAGGYGNEVALWDNSGERLGTLPTAGSSLCFSRDGRLLAVGGALRGTVHVWDIENQEVVQEYQLGGGRASVAFLPRGELLIGANEMLMRRHIAQHAIEVADSNAQVDSEESAIDVSATGDLLVAGYGRYLADPGEGTAIYRDLRSGASRLLPELDGSSVFDVAIDPTGKLIAVGGGPRYGPGFVKFWDARTGVLANQLPEQENCITSLAFSPRGDRLAVVSYGQVTVWESVPRKPKLVWPGNIGGAFRVAYSPAGDVLAVGCFVSEEKEKFPNQLVLLDAQSGELLETVSRDRAIMDVAFSPDGRLLTSIDWQGVVEIYDLYHKQVVLSELVHEAVGYSVEFSPDGRTLASCSNNGEINFWHVPTLMLVTTRKVRGPVGELKFFPDGQTLAVGYNDRRVELWHLDREQEQFRIEAVAE